MAVTRSEKMFELSPYVTSYTTKPANGRRSLFTSEFADWSQVMQEGTVLEDKGLFILGVAKYPPIFTESENTFDGKMCKGVMNWISQTATSVDGIQAKTLTNAAPEFKSQFITVPMFTNIEGATKEITINVPAEMAGYGVTDLISLWTNAISDEVTGYAHYNGTTLDWSNYAHSCTWYYMKPDQRLKKLRYGAFFFQSVPTAIPYDNYNADRAARGSIQLSTTWTCTLVDSTNVLVRDLLEKMLVKYEAMFCIDSTQYGSIKETTLEMISDIKPEDIIEKQFKPE